MDGLAEAARQIEDEFLVDWCRILDNRHGAEGVLDRATRTVTLPEGAVRYEGPCSVSMSQSLLQRDDQNPAVTDETLFRIRRSEEDVLAVGQIVQLRGGGQDRVRWSEFEIVRIPARSHKMTAQFYARRTTSKPTTG